MFRLFKTIFRQSNRVFLFYFKGQLIYIYIYNNNFVTAKRVLDRSEIDYTYVAFIVSLAEIEMNMSAIATHLKKNAHLCEHEVTKP